MEYFWLLLVSSILFCVSETQGMVFKTDSGEFHSVLVTESDDVIARDDDTLLQFHRGEISDSGLVYQVDIPVDQIFDNASQTFRYKPTVFQLFDLTAHQYLLQCHFYGCSIYDATDIRTSNVIQKDYYSEHNIFPHSATVSAQLVIFKTDPEYMMYHSAFTDSEEVNTLSLGYLSRYGNITTMSTDYTFQSKRDQKFDFVYSFLSGNKYSYFIRNVNTENNSKVMISQMCNNEDFRSYMETELQCGNYSHVLSATTIVTGFKSFLAVAMDDHDTSALCIYDFQKLEEHFNNTLYSCFKLKKGSWPQWIDGTGESCTTVYSKNEFYCGHTSLNTRIVSGEALTTQHIFKLDGHVANHDMIFKTYGDTVIGYIGFRIGNILKIIFEPSTMQITRHELFNVSNDQIRQIVLSNNGAMLFYISSNELGKILVDPAKCPLRIDKITPLNGTIDGGTMLTISGEFGYYSAYNSNPPNVAITIGNSTCQMTQPNTLNSIICKTQEQTSSGNLTIRVNISIDKLYATSMSCHASAEYDSTFSYLEPVFDNSTTMETKRIQLTGCTPIRIHGKYLDIGSKREIFVGDKLCTVISYNSTTVTCKSPEQTSVGDYRISYTLDHTTLSGPLVTYVPEPNITSIEPQYILQSGGIAVTIAGENLDVLGTSYHLYFQQVQGGDCELQSNGTSHTVVCHTKLIEFVPEVHPVISDGECANVSVDIPIWMLHDPIMEIEDQSVIASPDQNHVQLFFQGSNLTHIRGIDVKISVGNPAKLCVDVEVLDDGISCSIPVEYIPKHVRERVTCSIGDITYNLGTITLVEMSKTTASQEPPETTNYSGYIIGSLFVSAFVACIIAFLVRRRKKKKYSERYSVRFNSDGRILSLEGLSETPISETNQSRTNDYLSSRFLRADNACTNVKETVPLIPQIDRDIKDLMDHKHLLISKNSLVMAEIIGQGHFGCVYKGNLQQETEKEERIVACKTVHRNNPADLDVNSFLKEALVMKDFHHKNVMELIGVCLGINALPIVVLPYMRKGDLLSYIRNISNVPTVKQLVLFGVDITNGMDYLSQLKFVHRDLAARNCMIDDDMTVKVADFGLSRDVYEKEYYTSCDKKAKLPVKWMSPESLEFGHFSTKSDVWSFGILMWELLTRGVNPYPTVDGWDILRYLKTGRRLDKPEFCPDEMHRILQCCWENDPDKRPTFGELTVSIPELLRKLERASERRKLFSSRSVDTADTTDHVIAIDNVTIRGEGVVIDKKASSGEEDKKEELKVFEESFVISKLEALENKSQTQEKSDSEDHARKANEYVNKDMLK